MDRRKEIALVTAGILAGIAVSGPAAQAAAGLMANPSSQRFYVNEQRVNLEAYEIGGSNYVKLPGYRRGSGVRRHLRHHHQYRHHQPGQAL